MGETLRPGEFDRVPSEQFIKNSEKLQGYVPALLHISADQAYDDNVRLCAAVQLGRFVEEHWAWDDEDATIAQDMILISQSDKDLVRKHIVEKMYTSPQERVIKQYSRCIKCMAKEHKKWPGLKEDIRKALTSQNEKGI